jgi:hypothetical protein
MGYFFLLVRGFSVDRTGTGSGISVTPFDVTEKVTQ